MSGPSDPRRAVRAWAAARAGEARPEDAGAGPSLRRLHSFAVSVAIIGPTLVMAFNVRLAALSAGRAAPLAFLVGCAAMILVGWSLASLARRAPGGGSVAAYVAASFGPRWGFLAGWALLLTYGSFGSSTLALAGMFLSEAAVHAGVATRASALALAAVAGVLVLALSGSRIRGLVDLMLALEAVAVLAVLGLAVAILAHVGWSAAPFVPDPGTGLAGLGRGTAFAVLSFAGFEGAAAFSDDTRRPREAVPRAVIGSLMASGLVFVVVAYAQVLGFGVGRVSALEASGAPLDDLAARFVASGYGVLLDVCAGVSAFACALGASSAAARIAPALLPRETGREAEGRPVLAARLVAALNLAGLLAVGGWTGAQAYAEGGAAIGALSILPVYVGLALAQAWRAGRRAAAVPGVAGAAALAWPLLLMLKPARAWPEGAQLLGVATWLAAGAILVLRRDRAGFSSDRLRGPDERTLRRSGPVFGRSTRPPDAG